MLQSRPYLLNLASWLAITIEPRAKYFLLNPTLVPKYIIEREIPGAGKLTADQLKSISQTSCGVLSNMGPQIQWVESYVTEDKIYCIYNAPNKEMIVEHAKQGGFPANAVNEVTAIIDPVTAE